jgi:hypothetical protein
MVSQVKFIELFLGAQDFSGADMHTVDVEDLLPSDLGDYSLSLWIQVVKVRKGRVVTIAMKGSGQVCQPCLTLDERTLVARFQTETSVETLLASNPITAKEWTHVVFSMREDPEFTEATLFINGRVEAEIAVKSRAVMNTSKLFLGKDPLSFGFVGSLAEPLLLYSALKTPQVLEMYERGVQNFKAEGVFRTSHTFSFNTRRSLVNSESFGVLEPPILVDQLAEFPFSKSRHGTRIPSLVKVLDKRPELAEQASFMLQYFDWLAPFFIILRNTHPIFKADDGSLEPKIEIARMLPALKQVRVSLTKDDLVSLAKAAKAHELVVYGRDLPSWSESPEDDVVSFFDLTEKLNRFFNGEEVSVLETSVVKEEEDPAEKYSALFRKADDFLNNRMGSFEVCIDYCVGCSTHQTTFRHREAEYADMHNQVYRLLADEFPDVEVVGNKYGPPQAGHFTVFLEGVGPAKLRDAEGRLYLYKHKEGSRLYPREMLDFLYLMVYCYGGAAKFAAAQAEYRKENGEKPKDPSSSAGIVAAPAEKPKKVRKPKTEEEHELDTPMYCLNWGCENKLYIYGKNHKKACRSHPGRWEFGSIHGLWPENWTCCRKEWLGQGCRRVFHRGVPNSFVTQKCIARGAINPHTNQPDSTCGLSFPDPATCGKKYVVDSSACKIHSGFKEISPSNTFIWNCCGVELGLDEIDRTFCVEQAHSFASWPDEEAKSYFVTKSVSNPGIQRSQQSVSFKAFAKTSRFFNTEIKPYVDPYQKKMDRANLMTVPRYCLHSACEKEYKDENNTDTSCICHPGYWDFGHAGMQITSNGETQRIVLWDPHWTCCRRDWESTGCTQMRHKGPLLEKLPERKWRWPSEGAKRYFKKKTSQHWKDKLASKNLSRPQLAEKFDRLLREMKYDLLPARNMHRMCMALNLHILCVSEDIGFMFKYQDVVSGLAEKALQNDRGDIRRDDFLNWWFAPLEEIRPGYGAS